MITEISCINDITILSKQMGSGGFIYRGQKNYSWQLEATIQRPENKAVLNREREIYDQFRQELQNKDLPGWNPEFFAAGQWLALMQHYRLPTRLLDWTEDFHVGLYFACEDSDCDGALYVLKHDPLYEAAINFMSSIKLNPDIKASDRRPFFHFPEDRFEYFRSGSGSSLVIPMKPLIANERQQIQKGVFTVSNDITKRQDKIIEENLPNPANNFVKVRIKQTAKSDILQFLKSQHKLTHDYLMSPIVETASRIKTMYSSAK